MLSMTGFANKSFLLTTPDSNKVHVSMSLKTVNSRFFEVNCKVPYTLSHLETKFIKTLKPELHRGKIYLTIYMNGLQALQGEISPAINTIQAYKKAIETIQKDCSIAGQLSLDNILRLPNIFSVEEKELDPTYIQKIMDELTALIEDLNKARAQEGAVLQKDLMQRFTIMQKEIDAIEKASAITIEKQKKKVSETLQELEEDESAFAEARKNALYAILDKIDIHEEIVRFKSHLENLKKQLTSDNVEKGKRIDFTLQELAREINTISAKCSDAAIGSRAIDVKVEIEKAREQVQNIV